MSEDVDLWGRMSDFYKEGKYMITLPEVLFLYRKNTNSLSSGFKKAAKNNVRIRIIGNKSGLAKDIQDTIAELEEESKDNTGLQFQIAINYGSRDEIIRGIKQVANDTPDHSNQYYWNKYIVLLEL